MRSKIQEKVLQVLLKALKPLVHLLLEVGIGHREFSEIAKRAYVEVATKNYGIRGRDTNISRVAVMTGLTRKEVKRIRDSEDDDLQAPRIKPIPASLVLQHWYEDDDCRGPDGSPKVLEFAGKQASFSSLVKKYAGDIPPGALRTELLRAGAVVETDDGHLRAKRRTFRLIDSETQLLWSLERGLAGMTSNLAHNYLLKNRKNSDRSTWPNRVAESLSIKNADLPEVREFVSQCATRYSVEVDEFITKFEGSCNGSDRDSNTDVFFGVFYFED